jgi:hypothetical protein
VGNGFFPAGQDDGSGRRPGSAAARTSIHLGRVAVGGKMELVWGLVPNEKNRWCVCSFAGITGARARNKPSRKGVC